MSVERTALGVTGAAFLLRALSSRLPWYARLGYALAGWHMLAGATRGESVPSPIGQMEAGAVPSALVPLKMEPRVARSIGERVASIHEQALKGVEQASVYALARSAVNRKCGEEWCVPEKDAVAECTALFNLVRKHVRYTWDPINYDAFQTPEKTLELRTGDCDDQTSLLCAMAMSIGYKAGARVVHTKGFDTWNHIYAIVQLPDGTWMALDPTVNQPAGWEVPASHLMKPPRDFLIPVNKKLINAHSGVIYNA